MYITYKYIVHVRQRALFYYVVCTALTIDSDYATPHDYARDCIALYLWVSVTVPYVYVTL